MILLDYKDSRPIYEQVAEKLQELMLLGVLEEDAQMPSVRSLATELSINPNTIQRAYGKLEQGGFLYSVKGRGSFVGSIRRLKEARRTDLEKKLLAIAQEAGNIGLSREDFTEAAGAAYDRCVTHRLPPEHSGVTEETEEPQGGAAPVDDGKMGSRRPTDDKGGMKRKEDEKDD